MSSEKSFKKIEKQVEATEANYKEKLGSLQKQVDDVQAVYSEYLQATQRKTAQAQSRKDKAHQQRVTELEEKISKLQGSISSERDKQRAYKRDGEQAQQETRQLLSVVNTLSAFPDNSSTQQPASAASTRTDSSKTRSKSSKGKRK